MFIGKMNIKRPREVTKYTTNADRMPDFSWKVYQIITRRWPISIVYGYLQLSTFKASTFVIHHTMCVTSCVERLRYSHDFFWEKDTVWLVSRTPVIR